VTSILLSTDMYTLIDEGAIVPFDPMIKTADDQAWLKSFYPAFMANSQTGGKTWGFRSSARQSSSITTRRRSRRRDSTRTARPRTGRK
jgi:hypothetical protein